MVRYVENALIMKMEGEVGGYVYFKYLNNTDDTFLYETLRLKNVSNLVNFDGSEIVKEYKV